MSTDQELLYSAEFQARRRLMLASAGRLFGGSALGLAVYVVLCESSPAIKDGDTATALLVVLFAVLGFDYWRTLRNDWRCPACEVRWDGAELLASSTWNHCGDCGAPLRAAPQGIEPAAPPVDGDAALAERFLARRRTAMFAAGGVGVAGIAAFLWVHAHGWGDLAEQIVLAGFFAASVATGVHGMRCPRCRTGVVKGRAQHCPRCGWALPGDAPARV